MLHTPASSLYVVRLNDRPSRSTKRTCSPSLSRTAFLLSVVLLASAALAESPSLPTSLSFGDRALNQSGEPMSVTLKNTQRGPLTLKSIAITGDAAADYKTGGDCPLSPATLGAGISCTITVTFTPSAAGLRNATLTIADTAHALSRSLALTGNGVTLAGLTAATINSAGNAAGAIAGQQNAPDASAAISGQELLRRPIRPGVSTGAGLLPISLAPLTSTGSTVSLASIAVTPLNPSIGAGGTVQFTATGVYNDGTTVNLTSAVGWDSSSPGVAAINGAGLATGVTAGSTVITASYASVSSPPVAKADAVTVGAGPIGISSPGGLSGSTALTVTAPTAAFSSTGSMNSPRAGQTATLLMNGLVLVAGGQDDNSGDASSTAEIYDPTTGVFTPTGSLNTARAFHTATLMPNGQVLIAGGCTGDCPSPTKSVEIYDPATATFTPTGSMIYNRQQHTATLLPNGQVLIAGGITDGYYDTTVYAELYNPVSGTFSYTGSPMVQYRYLHTATLLQNGTVLIAGGNTGDGLVRYNTAEIYDPADQTFTLTASGLNSPRELHTATLLNNGLVLVAGGGFGCTGSNCVNAVFVSAELYNPATQTFSYTAGTLKYARESHTATLLTNGQVLFAGGDNGTNINSVIQYVAQAELFDPASNTFAVTASLNTPVDYDTATLLPNGGVLLAGGIDDSNNDPVSSAELYTPATQTPPNLASISIVPLTPTIPLGTGQSFTAYGTYAGGDTEPLAGVIWTSSNPGAISISNDASDAGAAWAQATGTVIISACAGAVCGSTTATASVPGPNYPTGTASFTPTSSLNNARSYHTATLLTNGTVLFAGGEDQENEPLGQAEVYDPTAGTFLLSGNLQDARYSHTATLLNNGMVLIVGGYDANGIAGMAELFNPATGVFTYTGSLNTGRAFHTATLLANGTVLIAGGIDINANPLLSAEIYDPVSGAFTFTGSLQVAHYSHTATLLDDGTVLVAGGIYNTQQEATTDAEIFNPTTSSFTTTAGMNIPRSGHTATLLNNGQVLVAGGDVGGPGNTAEIYIPATQTFTFTTSPITGRQTTMNTPRQYHTATLLTNGTVLIAGGDEGIVNDTDTLAPTAELYYPSTGQFVLTGNLVYTAEYGTATLLNNGTVLLAGGEYIYDFFDFESSNAQIYDPATLTPAGLLSIAIAPAAPTIPLGSGQHFTATGTFSGGNSEQLAEVTWSSSDPGVISVSDDASNSGEAWAANTGSATITACAGLICGSTTATVGPLGPNSITGTATFAGTAGSLNTPRWLHTATLLNNGLVLIAGGENSSFAPSNSAELYDPTAGTFTPTGSLNTARDRHTATLLSNGMVLITGGQGAGTSAELYNTANGTFTPTGSLETARSGHSATLLPNGMVLIAGGSGDTSAELYDPATGTFAYTGTLNAVREFQTATLLNNGTVLIAGGEGAGDAALASAELYNPATQTFTLTGNLNVERYGHTATLLNNGMVLVAGGLDSQQDNILGDAELYNPATGAFTATGALNTPRYDQTATLLNNGNVLIAGGENSSDEASNSAELYDPIAGAFVPTGNLNAARELDTATLLDNGTVLIAGGYNVGPVPGAELYQPATLTPPNLVSISLAPDSATVPLGSALRFTATGTFSGGNTQQLGSVTWSSSDPGVVSVSNDASDAGSAWAASAGSATITACAGAVCGSTTATVNQGVVSITVTPSNATTSPGATQQFYALATYNNGATEDVTASADWDTTNASAATVAAGGLATGVAGGSTTITASLGSVQGSATLNVASVTVLGHNMNTGVALATATAIPNLNGIPGWVIVAGGNGSSGPSSELQQYGPGSRWASGYGLNTARYAHTATFLNTGDILFAGGMGPDGALKSAELFEPNPPDGVFGSVVYTAGNLATARYGHTATLLQSGRVLIAGGFDSNGNALSSAELYNPTTQTFTSAGNLNAARGWHTATLLNNGWVLFTGGSNSVGPISGAELYFPETGYFQSIGDLNAARAYHTATLLNNGNVLIAGGMSSNGAPLASAEIFNPGIEAFFATGNLNNARFSHAALLLGNGTVLMSGGVGASGFLASQEVYDPNLAGFSFTASLNVARAGHTATLINSDFNDPTIPNGDVVIAGGYNGNGVVSSSEQYTPETFAPPNLVSISITPAPYLSSPADLAPVEWEKLIAIGTFSDGSTAQLGGVMWTSSGEGAVSVLGDATNPGLCLNLYAPASGVSTITATLGTVSATTTVTVHSFHSTTTGSLNTPRWQHAATLLNNGQVLITGGLDSNGNTSNSAELYDPASGNFLVTGSLNTARKLHTSTLLNNGMVLIAGGTDSSNNTLTSAELYDPASGTFTPTGSMTTSLASHTATLLNNGMVLLAGGVNTSVAIGGGGYVVATNPTTTSQLYDSATGTFSNTGGLNAARFFHTANLLNDGTVLIAGGIGNGLAILGSAEIYNPSLGTFTTVPNSMINTRYAHTATILVGGTVLLTGGAETNFVVVDSGEVYDPTSQTFTATLNNMISPGYWQTGTLINYDEEVFIPGGFNGNPQSAMNVFFADRTTPEFGVTLAMTNARYLHTTTLLNNGMVLILGGAGASDVPVAEAELY